MKNLLLFSFLVLAVASCKKKTNVVIQAQDYITGNGSAYAGMEYAVVETWTPFLETKSEIVATGFLDENGHAAFDLKMKNNRKYILGVSQPDNICYGGVLQYYLDHEKNNNVEFKYLKCGYLNLPRVNVNCENSDDKFRLKYYYSADQEIYIYIGYLDVNLNWDPNKFLAGCIDYSNINVYNELPAGNYSVEWQVERQSGTTYDSVSLVVSENDTTTYIIQY